MIRNAVNHMLRSSRGPARLARQNAARYASFDAANQPRIRIGGTAPNFKAVTTDGNIDFHEFIGGSWTILFSHPADFTPVCTTELGAFSALKDEFTKRNTKLIGLSSDPVESHEKWVKDIEEAATQGKKFDFPIIADKDREVAYLYDMVDEEGFKNLSKGPIFTIRNVFIIDPKKRVRLFMVYPASTGRNTSEVLRVLDALQMTDRTGLVTPVDWNKGDDVIVPPSVSTEAAKEKYGDVKEVKSYLRYTKEPLESSFIPTSGSQSQNRIMLTLLALGGLTGFAFAQTQEEKQSVVKDLEQTISSLKRGEKTHIKEKLGAGNPAKEQEWDELMKEIEQSKDYFWNKK